MTLDDFLHWSTVMTEVLKFLRLEPVPRLLIVILLRLPWQSLRFIRSVEPLIISCFRHTQPRL